MGGQREGTCKQIRELKEKYAITQMMAKAEFYCSLSQAFNGEATVDEDNFSDGSEIQILFQFLKQSLINLKYALEKTELTARIKQGVFAPRAYDFDNNFRGLDQQRTLNYFRFDSMETIETVMRALEVPEEFVTKNRCKFSGIEGFLLLLTHLARDPTFDTLSGEGFTFGHNSSGCQLLQEVNRWLFLNWSQPLLAMPLEVWVDEIAFYRRKIRERIEQQRDDHPHDDLGKDTTFYVDGTVFPICRPTQNQTLMYNGRKKQHQVVYVAIVAPDGMCVRFDGSYTGRVHDSNAYGKAGIRHEMEELNKLYIEKYGEEDSRFVIYGDKAYSRSDTLEKPYYRGNDGNMLPIHVAHNRVMSTCRVDVERYFGQIKNAFKWGRTKGIKTVQSPYEEGDEKKAFDMKVWNSIFLQNVMVCLEESGISKSNNCGSLTLEEYLNKRREYYDL